jgi:putative zeta toxin; poison-antidote element
MISYEEEIELDTTIEMVSSTIAIIDIKTLNFATPEEEELSKRLYKTRHKLETGEWEYKDLEDIRNNCREIYNEYQSRPISTEIQTPNETEEALYQYAERLLEAKIYPSFFDYTKPQKHPQGFMIGGQPGVGKNNSKNEVIQPMGSDVIVINMNEFRRYHPHIQKIYTQYGKYHSTYTHEFACYIADKIFERALEGNYNIVIESSFRNADTILAILRRMKAQGYQTGVAMVAVPAEESWQRIVDRFTYQTKEGEAYPRFTPKSYHDSAIDYIAANSNIVQQSGLADTFIINDQQGNRLYTWYKSEAVR